MKKLSVFKLHVDAHKGVVTGHFCLLWMQLVQSLVLILQQSNFSQACTYTKLS